MISIKCGMIFCLVLVFNMKMITCEKESIEDLMAFVKLNIQNEKNPNAIISQQEVEDEQEFAGSQFELLKLIVDRFDKVLSFIELNYKNINLDGLFGIRIAEGI